MELQNYELRTVSVPRMFMQFWLAEEMPTRRALVIHDCLVGALPPAALNDVLTVGPAQMAYDLYAWATKGAPFGAPFPRWLEGYRDILEAAVNS